MIDKILQCLQQKILKSAMGERGQKVDMVLRDSIFKIACRLIEKMLVIEVKKMQPSNMFAFNKQ